MAKTDSGDTPSTGDKEAWLAWQGHSRILWPLWALCMVTLVWRLGIALQVCIESTLPAGQGGMIHWRELDQFIGWAAILLLWIAGGDNARVPTPTTALRRERRGILFTGVAAFGMLMLAASIACDEWDLSAALAGLFGWLSDILLAFTGVLLAIRELAIIQRALQSGRQSDKGRPTKSGGGESGRGGAGGITIVDLWRIIIVQWILIWIGAVVYLRFHLSRDELLGNDHVRQLLFGLPACGLMLNLMMFAGIRWAVRLPRPGVAAPRPRIRAWLITFFFINAGAVLMVARGTGSPLGGIGIAGGVLMIIAIGMYLVGFPQGFFRRQGIYVLAAWGVIALGIAIATAERIFSVMPAGSPLLSMTFVASAWRHLLITGGFLWLMGMGAVIQEQLLPAAWRAGSRQGIFVAAISMGIGIFAIDVLLLWAATKQGEAQVPALGGLIIGALAEAIGLLIAGAVLLRTTQLLKRA